MTDPAIEATPTSPATAPGSGASKVDRLVAELRGFGLSDVDAHRAAFCTLALADGWSKARIGRYLGVSRARVGQKVEKLNDYTFDDRVKTPTLNRLMSVADSARPWLGRDGMVEFEPDAWEDIEFARSLCDIPGR
jgi:hypothetical protein